MCAELQSIFEMFDKNKDGKISCEELGVVLRTLGHRYSQAEVEEMIKNADKNGEETVMLLLIDGGGSGGGGCAGGGGGGVISWV